MYNAEIFCIAQSRNAEFDSNRLKRVNLFAVLVNEVHINRFDTSSLSANSRLSLISIIFVVHGHDAETGIFRKRAFRYFNAYTDSVCCAFCSHSGIILLKTGMNCQIFLNNCFSCDNFTVLIEPLNEGISFLLRLFRKFCDRVALFNF